MARMRAAIAADAFPAFADAALGETTVSEEEAACQA
jgi:hypothetical protein